MDVQNYLIDKLRMEAQGSSADLLADHIKRLIMDGEIKPGYVFPTETVFCEQLGVSRSTLREAYKALESTGFIRRVKRLGTIVNDFQDISRSAPLRTSLIMSSFDELMEFRMMFESELAALAAQRATPDNLQIMENSLKKMENSRTNIVELTHYDTTFHMEIAHASGNRIFLNTMENAKDIFQQGVFDAFQVDTVMNVSEAVWYHREILNAIAHHDSEVARQLMREHIESVGRRVAGEDEK